MDAGVQSSAKLGHGIGGDVWLKCLACRSGCMNHGGGGSLVRRYVVGVTPVPLREKVC